MWLPHEFYIKIYGQTRAGITSWLLHAMKRKSKLALGWLSLSPPLSFFPSRFSTGQWGTLCVLVLPGVRREVVEVICGSEKQGNAAVNHLPWGPVKLPFAPQDSPVRIMRYWATRTTTFSSWCFRDTWSPGGLCCWDKGAVKRGGCRRSGEGGGEVGGAVLRRGSKFELKHHLCVLGVNEGQ